MLFSTALVALNTRDTVHTFFYLFLFFFMNIEHGAVCWENEASLVIAPNCFFQRSQSDFVILFSKPWDWVSWLQLSTQTVVQVRKYVRWLSLPQVIDLSFQFISIHLSLSLSISLSGKSFPSECNHIARRFVILVFLLHQHFFLSSVRLSVGLSLLLSVALSNFSRSPVSASVRQTVSTSVHRHVSTSVRRHVYCTSVRLSLPQPLSLSVAVSTVVRLTVYYGLWRSPSIWLC